MGVLPSDVNYIESISVSTNRDLPTFKEYGWDFENNDFIIQDGELVIVEENEALKIWIYKVLRTPKFRYLAFSFAYGNRLESLVGKICDTDLFKSELKRLLEECLLISNYITSINSVDVTLEDEKLTGTIGLTTVYSSLEMEVDLSV